jgi:tRNA(fMet)-specific endonuclease VapC
MLVLDTDLLSIVERAASVEYARLLTRLPAGDPLQVHATIVSFEEQARGWLAYLARARSIEQQINAYARLHKLLDNFSKRPVLDFDQAAADQFQQLRKTKLRIGTMDLKIASIVLANGATLLSRNLSDFRRVPRLQVEDWTV